ncbi:ATP-binding protein [Streptomyces sp. NBC_01476]|uniref:ATP-binding protein n=1 Tax=Streptomyces sp. NBC_01476 TaxID=2903881 RepID=UPI002E375E72|nr:ATP-binding protein [Streptomyces sp. NBC_01476]
MEPPCDAGYALPTSAAAARDLVRALLERQPAPPAGRPAPAEQTVTDVLLVTSELVTNAIRHAGGVTAFTAVVEDGFVYVMVGDASSAPPVRSPAAAPGRPGGYGWPLVCSVAEDVTVTTHRSGGKDIRVRVRLN